MAKENGGKPALSRADYLFVIGYDGNTAVVNGEARRRYAKLSTEQLLQNGLFKAAFCSADYAADQAGLQAVCTALEQRTGQPYSVDDLRKLFGVYGVPSAIKRVIVA